MDGLSEDSRESMLSCSGSAATAGVSEEAVDKAAVVAIAAKAALKRRKPKDDVVATRVIS